MYVIIFNVRNNNERILSIIVPCFNEEKALPIFYDTIKEEINRLKNIDTEIILVDDGSKDYTLIIAKELNNIDKRVKVISFSRNFGKEAALIAGLEASKGDYVVVMDADLQDPPALLEKMINKLNNDNNLDCVGTRRVTRKGEPPIRSFFARKFYKYINKMIDFEIIDGARDFRMMRRSMVNAILSLSEKNRFSKGIFAWVGFKTEYIEYVNVERVAGETKWSFWKLLRYAIQGFVGFTVAPLRAISIAGVVSLLITIVASIWFLASALINGINVSADNYTLIFLGIFGSGTFIALGIIGEYIASISTEVKNRPIYIVKEKIF